MGSDDDIAASLPRPPLPAPAPREATIEEALRRFDGGERRPPASAGGGRAGRPAPSRSLTGRPWAGALAGAFLVALIALPIAWMSLDRPSMPGGSALGTKIVAQAAPSAPAAPAAPAADAPRPALPTSSQSAPPPRAGSGAAPSSETPAVKEPGPAPARVALAEPAPPPPAPPPPVETPLKAAESATRMAEARTAEPKALAGSNIVVTGTRVGSRADAPAAPSAEMADSTIVMTGTRVRARSAARGDWNACTVDDPGRSLGACRKLVGPGHKGATGRPAAAMADGLSLAWEGDFEGAIRAFDRAIQVAPRSSFAYLNRGLAHRRRGDLDHALADLDLAVRYAPGAARAYYNRSLVLRQLGDSRRARADEERAADLDPRYDQLAQ